MKNIFSKKGIVAITDRTLRERKPEVVQIMQYYGMQVNNNDSPTKINLAFLSLVPRSRGFRKDFSALATQVAENMPLEEVELNAEEFLNINGLKPRGIGQPTSLSTDELKKLEEQWQKQIVKTKKETKTMSEKTAKERKAFGDTRVGELLTNETVQNLINAGLQIYTYKKIGGAPSGTTNPSDFVINSANVDNTGSGGNAPPPSGGQTPPKKDDDNNKGVDATKIILFSVGGLALIGTAFYFFNRNR
jgi:hypothetical protein